MLFFALRRARSFSSHERRRAALELAQYRGNRSLRALIGLLCDIDVDVRTYAAASLGELGDTAAVSDLVLSFRSAHSAERSAAARSLKKLGWMPRDPEDKVLWADEWGDQDALCQSDARLLVGLLKRSPKKRGSIIDLLANRYDSDVFYLLTAGIRSELVGTPRKSVFVDCAIEILGRSSDPSAAAFLIWMECDFNKSWEYFQHTTQANALERLHASTESGVLDALAERTPSKRLWVLERLTGARASQMIYDVLGDQDRINREKAAELLSTRPWGSDCMTLGQSMLIAGLRQDWARVAKSGRRGFDELWLELERLSVDKEHCSAAYLFSCTSYDGVLRFVELLCRFGDSRCLGFLVNAPGTNYWIQQHSYEKHHALVNALTRLGPTAAERLVERLGGSEREWRCDDIRINVICKCAAPSSVGPLASILRSGSSARGPAAQALLDVLPKVRSKLDVATLRTLVDLPQSVSYTVSLHNFYDDDGPTVSDPISIDLTPIRSMANEELRLRSREQGSGTAE